jgi:hypothetical protein
MQLKDQSSAPQECPKSLALTEGIDLTRTVSRNLEGDLDIVNDY